MGAKEKEKRAYVKALRDELRAAAVQYARAAGATSRDACLVRLRDKQLQMAAVALVAGTKAGL